MDAAARSERTRVRQAAGRGVYDHDAIAAILDEGLIAHVGVVADAQPYVIPMVYARDGDRLLLHGAPLGRLIGALAGGADVCVTVTLLDGVVLARSAFHHSMNYRSVVVIGRAHLIEDAQEKLSGFERIVEHLVPGRWAQARQPNAGELTATSLFGLPLLEASAKIRAGPPIDATADYESGVWAGVIPALRTFGPPVADGRLAAGIAAPPNVASYRRPAH
ncbi:MAG: pyridoxamine 5'-phosphate oxidase family protein [Candidatus Eremiobacteraeota bacterium]|nr:pyridoxamine 5'-phosphate oxidase family protein [Candidatus Eremiobacteraeota bacterium]